MDMHEMDLAGLERRVTTLSDALVHLGKTEDLRRLILALKKPGWTTPAEFIFASSIVDSMNSQVTALTKLKSELVRGGEAVNAK